MQDVKTEGHHQCIRRDLQFFNTSDNSAISRPAIWSVIFMPCTFTPEILMVGYFCVLHFSQPVLTSSVLKKPIRSHFWSCNAPFSGGLSIRHPSSLTALCARCLLLVILDARALMRTAMLHSMRPLRRRPPNAFHINAQFPDATCAKSPGWR